MPCRIVGAPGASAPGRSIYERGNTVMVLQRGGELEVVQRAYDLILWEVPLITRFPVPYRAVLGDRMQTTLYAVLERLIEARYDRARRAALLRLVSL